MALYQMELWKRVPYSPNPAGYYVWSSTYYWESSDFATVGDMIARCKNVDRIHTISQVEYIKQVMKLPPGRANVVTVHNLLGQFGLIVSGTSEYTLLNVGRLRLFYDDGRTSYRYWRAPVLLSWLDGGRFNAFARSRMASYINNQTSAGGFPPSRNIYGGSLLRGTVPTDASAWQMRHGTHRRERQYP